ncbi:MAG: phosphatidate cytidylyltransferase [Thermoflavifilum sp.]|nr:phosphatidate cytidylyltransferase [Thermoflavifilum sp.]MCL6513407.1 phosphatidate cytidylyltransferase [Alicyclobacillus sp.]
MLKQRVITAAFGLTLVVLVMIWGPLPWHWLVWVGAVICAAEYTRLWGFSPWSLMSLWAYLLVTYVVWRPDWHTRIAIQTMAGLALLWPVVLRNRVSVTQSATVFLGALYVGYGGEALAALRALPRGWAWLLLLLAAIWLTDTAAYFVGRHVGGPKLWPSISPNKTVSGALAGVVAAAVATVVVGYLCLPGFDLWSYALVGVLISITGQLGDLIESAYKRAAGVKDSGSLLPGHGGMLDRVDSLLFAAPFAAYLIQIGATHWFQ